MPAVKWFALYAAVSLTLNFLMQITCFVAAMSIDEQRRKKSIINIVCGKSVLDTDTDENLKKSNEKGI